jgi:hypothetical protein
LLAGHADHLLSNGEEVELGNQETRKKKREGFEGFFFLLSCFPD